MSTLLLNETHELPEWMEKSITTMGGTRDDKPLYRVVWGGNRWVPGPDGLTLIHPYSVNHWHLEKWHKGQYEHCYRFGQCKHMLPGDKEWCNRCKLSGGDFVDVTNNFSLIQRAIRLFILSENMQNSSLQKNALMERERKAKQEQAERIENIVGAKAIPSVKRSKDVRIKHSANEIFGNEGFKQIN